jgi:hypothetical protein
VGPGLDFVRWYRVGCRHNLVEAELMKIG